MESALFSIGQIAVTLAGFAALLRAFRQKNAADAHSDPRLLSIVEQGLVVVLLCFLPTVLMGFGLGLEFSVRIVSALAAIWLIRWLRILYVARSAELSRPLKFAYQAAVSLHIATFAAFTVCAIGVLGRFEPLYLAGVVLLVVEVGWTFLIQFQSERS